MKLFEMKDWSLRVSDEAWALLPFKKLLDRDKTKNKDVAFKEMMFIYFFADIKSDYMILTSEEERIKEIKKDIGLPEKWSLDADIKAAIDFYQKRSLSVIAKLYINALKAANAVSEYLTQTEALLAERDNNGKPVNTITTIVGGIKQIKTIMQDLKAAEKEVLKEKEDMEGRKKGSQTLSIFEDGL